MFCVLLLLFTRGREKARERERVAESQGRSGAANKNNNWYCNYGTYQNWGDLSTHLPLSLFLLQPNVHTQVGHEHTDTETRERVIVLSFLFFFSYFTNFFFFFFFADFCALFATDYLT